MSKFVIPLSPEPPALFRHLFTSTDTVSIEFRFNTREYNNCLAMGNGKVNLVSRDPGHTPFNPKMTVHGRISHYLGALVPPSILRAYFLFVNIHDTD